MEIQSEFPSGNLLHSHGKAQDFNGKTTTISMVILNSYVKLPEGMLEATSVFQDYAGERRRLRVSHCLSLTITVASPG